MILRSIVFFLIAVIASAQDITLNEKDEGYRGIWYMNQPSGDEYVYKYSGGLGTYCAKHKPFAVYCGEVEKTFFCYGGTAKDGSRRLLHMVSCFDHKTGSVPRPTVLLDKKTDDAHDNPVISVDDKGFVWIFSTSHGTKRPSYVHRSLKPYDITRFELIRAKRRDGDNYAPLDNFSYMQAWHVARHGFICFFTKYGYPAARTICFMTSPDGVRWSEWQRLAAIEKGHYQISAVGRKRAGSAFNYHPKDKGLNWRSNLYYVETRDFGKNWCSAGGTPLKLPLKRVDNPALLYESRSKGTNVYLKDIQFDAEDRPVILGIRPEGIRLGARARQSDGSKLTGRAQVEVIEPLGYEAIIYASIGSHSLATRTESAEDLGIGDLVPVSFDQKRLHLFDKKTQESLLQKPE